MFPIFGGGTCIHTALRWRHYYGLYSACRLQMAPWFLVANLASQWWINIHAKFLHRSSAQSLIPLKKNNVLYLKQMGHKNKVISPKNKTCTSKPLSSTNSGLSPIKYMEWEVTMTKHLLCIGRIFFLSAFFEAELSKCLRSEPHLSLCSFLIYSNRGLI